MDIITTATTSISSEIILDKKIIDYLDDQKILYLKDRESIEKLIGCKIEEISFETREKLPKIGFILITNDYDKLMESMVYRENYKESFDFYYITDLNLFNKLKQYWSLSKRKNYENNRNK